MNAPERVLAAQYCHPVVTGGGCGVVLGLGDYLSRREDVEHGIGAASHRVARRDRLSDRAARPAGWLLLAEPDRSVRRRAKARATSGRIASQSPKVESAITLSGMT